MTSVEFSAEFATFPNDPDLWRVYRDFLLDNGDEEGAEKARLRILFWQLVKDEGWEPYHRHRNDGSSFLCGWAWANPAEDARSSISFPHTYTLFPPLTHPCYIKPPQLFNCLPEGDWLDSPAQYWLVTWKTPERAWDALWRAWLVWSREATHE